MFWHLLLTLKSFIAVLLPNQQVPNLCCYTSGSASGAEVRTLVEPYGVNVGLNLKFLESVWSQTLPFMSATPLVLVYHENNLLMFILFLGCENWRKWLFQSEHQRHHRSSFGKTYFFEETSKYRYCQLVFPFSIVTFRYWAIISSSALHIHFCRRDIFAEHFFGSWL